MDKSKKINPKMIVIICAAVLVLAIAVLTVCIAFGGNKIIPANGAYSFENPEKVKAEPDDGFVIDGVLDEKQYQNCNWLKLQNTQGGAGATIAMTSFYGQNGMYIVYDISEGARTYVNPDRPTYLNSCIEMYLATSNASSMSSNEIFEIDMLPTGDLAVRQRTGKDNWVNVASTDDIMAHLGATTKGGPVNTEECTGYNLELFIPWAYLDKVGIDASAMKESFFYINPVHITSHNYDGTDASSDRYWYGFATQLGSDGWNDVSQFFRFGAQGVLGTVPVELITGKHCTVTGSDSVIPGMMTTVEITPEAGYALDSIMVNGEEYIQKASFNMDGSVTLELRGKKEGLTISASASAVTQGNKMLSGTVQVHKLGGDTLEGVSVSYKGPMGEKPITIDGDGKFQLSGLEQGYYTITASKQGYTPIHRGIYLNRDMETVLTLEFEMFQSETGYNWILDDQNDGVLNRFGGSGKILSVDSYDQFTAEAYFRYDTQLAAMSDTDNFLQQRSGIQIKFSNGKYWRIDLMWENGTYKVQYATHSDATLFTWKTVHNLTAEEIAKYQSEEGIKLSVLRDGNYVWVCLDGRPVAIEVLDSEYTNYTAQLGFEGWIANQEIAQMQYSISDNFSQNLRSFYVTTSTQWDISRQLEGALTLPKGGNGAIKFYNSYTDFDFTLKNVKEHDTTGKKPGRTDLLLEFDTNGDGKADKSVSFGIVCTDPATKTCWVQTLGNADNYIPATRISGLYKLSEADADQYLNGAGVELRVVRKGTDVYVFVNGDEAAVWDLTQNNSGVTASTRADLSLRHYDAAGDVVMRFAVSGNVENVKIDKVFKDNENWDLSKQLEGVVALPGGGTETSLQFFKKYQNIDLTVIAKENDITGTKPGRTDVLFEFDLNNDGKMDKNVSFGIVQLSSGRCVLQTLGWSENHIPEKRINELYELTYAQAQKYKGEGIALRVVRYETVVYLYLEDMQVAVFDLAQNNSGVQADSKATVFLRHYDAVADQVVIPFKLTDPVEKPEIQEQTKPVFKPNYAWDLSQEKLGTETVNGVEAIKGIASLPGGGTNAVAFYDQFTDIDLTITAKENKAESAANGGRTDVLFEFENGKNVSFGILKWSDTSSCIIETLGNSTNHIPANRKNTLYTLTEDQTNAYLTDGVLLRLVRSGTDVHVIVEDKIVAVFDLTQNGSGVTADMPAKVSLRHYDAVTDQVDIPFTVADEFAEVTLTDNSVGGSVGTKNESSFVGAEIVLHSKTSEKTLIGLKLDGAEVPLGADGTYSFMATKSSYTVEGIFASAVFEGDYDAALWDISGQYDGFVTVIGGGGSTGQPLQFAGAYENIDLTLNVRDYADSSTAARTDVEFVFENGQTVTFGVINQDNIPRVQTRGGTLLSWKSPYNLNQAEIAQFMIDEDEIAAGEEDGLDLRIVRYGTVIYLFVENKQVAYHDLTICANANGDTASGITADTKMSVYLRHYDDARDAGVQIPFSISTDVAPVEVSISANDRGTVTTNKVNHYVNNAITSDYSTTHFAGEKITLTATPTKGNQLASIALNGEDVTAQAVVNDEGVATYTFVATQEACEAAVVFEEIKIFEDGYDTALWDISGQYDGYVTVIGGGGATTKPLQLAGAYQNVDLTLNARDYADSDTASRTEFGFEFDVDGDGVIDTANGDQTVTFGIAQGDRVQTRGGTLLSWKSPYSLNSAEKAQLVIDADELAAGNEDGLDLRIVRYGTVIYIFVEGKQVAYHDLTICANADGDTASGITADTQMYIYLRHYDDTRDAGVQIPFSISTDVEPIDLSITTDGEGTVTANKVNHYVNNKITSDYSTTHFAGEKVTLTATPGDAAQPCYKVTANGTVADAVTVNEDGSAVYVLNAVAGTNTVEFAFAEPIFQTGYNSAVWNLAKQYEGVLTLPNGGGATDDPLVFNKTFGDVDLSMVVRDYAASSTASRTDVEFVFDNGETVTFGVIYTGEKYRIQTRGGTLLDWKTPYYITDQAWIDAYVITESEMNSANPGGLNFRVVRYGTEFYLYLEGEFVKGYDFSYSIAADTPVTVKIRHYDDAGVKVEIPFSYTEDVTITNPRLFSEKEAVTDYAYSFAVLPDIQIVTENDVEKGEANLAKLMDWIVANQEAKNIQYVFGLGDNTENNNVAEWTLVQEQFAKLNSAGIPYSAIRGNHDLPGYRKEEGAEDYTTDYYTQYIGTEAYRAQFEGFYSEDNVSNSWRTFTVGTVKYLMLTMDYGPDDAVLSWASEVIAQHPEHNVIITTHAYLFRDGTTLDSEDIVAPSTSGGTYDGDDIWEKLVSKHENIVMVLCGHDPSENIIVNRSAGDNGNIVTSMLIDAQDVEAQEGSMGMVAMLYFSADGKNVQVEYYSTAKEKYFKSRNQFELELDIVENTIQGTGYVPVAGELVTSGAYASFPRTVEITFSTTDVSTRSILWGNCDGKTKDFMNLELEKSSGLVYLNMTLNGTTYRHSFTGVKSAITATGEIVRLTLVIEDTRICLYVNGELAQARTVTNGSDGSKTMEALLASAANASLPAGGWCIGDDLRSLYTFKGTIYDVAVWADARTADEVKEYTIASVGTEAYEDNLIAAYNFRASYTEGEEAPFATDLSGNGLNLSGNLNVGTKDDEE